MKKKKNWTVGQLTFSSQKLTFFFFWIFSNYSIPPDPCCHIRNFVTSRCISFKCRRFPSVSGWGGGGLNAPAACATLRNDQRGLQSAARLPKWEENSAQVKVGAEKAPREKSGSREKKIMYRRLPTCSTSAADITNPASVLLFVFKWVKIIELKKKKKRVVLRLARKDTKNVLVHNQS